MSDYRIVLSDGSESVPLTRAALENWLAEGRITLDTPILRRGMTRPVPLRQILGAGAKPGNPIRGGGARRAAPAGFDGWRLAAVVLGVLTQLALASTLVAAGSEGLTDALKAATLPWLFGCLIAVGLWMRMAAARGLLLGLIGLATVVIAGVAATFPPNAMLVIVPAAFAAVWVGFFVMLTGDATLPVAGAGAAVVVAAVVGLEVAEQKLVKSVVGAYLQKEAVAWGMPDRAFDDTNAGLHIDLPGDWLRLKPEMPVLAKIQNVSGAFMEPRVGTYAVLLVQDTVESAPSPDKHLSRVIKEFDWEDGKELDRVNTPLSKGEGRRARLEWTYKRLRIRGHASVWNDRTRYFTLFGWGLAAQEEEVTRTLAALEKSVGMSYPLTKGWQELLVVAGPALPHLDPAALGSILRKNNATSMGVGPLFREGYRHAIRGVLQLRPESVAEIKALNLRAVERMGGDRARYEAWTELVRGGQATAPEEDARLAVVFAAAFRSLSAADQERLQKLWANAVDSST